MGNNALLLIKLAWLNGIVERAVKPLSDQKICDLLQEEGIAVSRRTVAKYREEMGIGSTRERKSWKKNNEVT